MSSRQHNSENWIDEARRRLANWRGKKPETKAGQIWALWPEIKVAIEDGQSMKSIRLWLEEEAEIVVTTDSLRTYIHRCRAKDMARQKPDKPAAFDQTGGFYKSNRTNSHRSADAQALSQTALGDKPDMADDPLAAARKALNKTRFDIRKIHGDGDPSDRKLI